VHIAQEETKFGLDESELNDLLNNSISQYQNIRICGLMGMASLTDEMEKVKSEFKYLRSIFEKHAKLQTSNFKLQTLSMGMSSDYFVAIEEGSNMVRIGSLIFGARS
jgi:uncharacterized pyridoxal phosphate-containing UPF0001 family protein